ncbi:hypothetical protein ACFE04_007487 [Oxalis oulophora]
MPGISASPSKMSQTAPKRGPNKSRFNEDGLEIAATCHQCRQSRSVNVLVACKVIRQANAPCTVKLCNRCLHNRYGENKDDVLLLDDWKCPKCRGICNCSFCRKKEGQLPTGILAHTARENGFASVSDLLTVKSLDDCRKIVEEKENTKSDKVPKADSKLKKSKKKERNGLLELPNVNNKLNALPAEDIPVKPKKSESGVVAEKKKSKKQDTNNLSNGTNLYNKKKRKLDVEIAIVEPEIEMPKGTDLTNVAGVELLPEEIGEALQFLEFCAAFPEALNLRKGQAESIIRELARGKRRRKCGQYSALIQIHIELLTLIQKDMGIESPSLGSGTGKNSWLQALGELASESQNLLKEFPSNWFDRGATGYEELNNCQKLKLLNFLCDEALCTPDLRLSIEKQHEKFIESEKEAKAMITAARDKVSELQKKLKEEVTRSLIGQNSAPRKAGNQGVIDQLKSEVDAARSERLEAEGAQAKGKQRCDALRTEPILLKDNGCVFWRLNGYKNEAEVLLQDLGAWDSLAPHEKWLVYTEEQKQSVLKYLSSSRTKRVVASQPADSPSIECNGIKPIDSK